MVRRRVDAIELVSESAIERAIYELLETGKAVAEGAGAAAYAALMAERFPQLEGRRVVVIVSGANIDLNILNRIIERSLAKQSRLVRLHIRVPDRPGGLAALLAVVADNEANVLRIEHHRVFTDTSFWETDIELTLETRDRDHIDTLITALREHGYTRIQEVGVPLDPSPIRRPTRPRS
jgi:threonine dehydratase